MAKIVVVEDDVYMREELLNLLEKSGYDTIGLSDFENAVSEIAAYFPDLILLDINLPFRSGFEICKELKAKQIGTVLVLTARDKLQDELHALDLGADDYLTKPCNMSRLLARINDNGMSIPISDLPFVFDKGFTGDTGSYLSRSTGMGLYLVQKMANDLTIKVEIQTNSYGGTTVTLTFPKVERSFFREV